MTENEAIKNVIDYVYMEYEIMPLQVIKALDIMKDSTKGIQAYRAIGTVEECRDAVERMKPKKPTYEGDGYAPDGTFVWDEWLCPNCGNRYEVDYDDYEHCPNCGQAIDWREEREDEID